MAGGFGLQPDARCKTRLDTACWLLASVSVSTHLVDPHSGSAGQAHQARRPLAVAHWIWAMWNQRILLIRCRPEGYHARSSPSAVA